MPAHAPLRSLLCPPACLLAAPLLPARLPLLPCSGASTHLKSARIRLPLRFAANHARPLTPLANAEEQPA